MSTATTSTHLVPVEDRPAISESHSSSSSVCDLTQQSIAFHSAPATSVPLQSESWLSTFNIPWSKCPPGLLQDLDNKLVPSAADIRELVNHTVSDIFVFSRRPSREVLRCVARKIIHRQPCSFADYINGKLVADGVNSLMLMLESRKENLNRRLKPLESQSVPQRVKANVTIKTNQKPSGANTYSCKTLMPTPPDSESADKLEHIRCWLKCQYEVSSSEFSSQIDHDMLVTYAYQRYHINSGMPVEELLDKWPFLGTGRYLLMHCKNLTGIDIEPTLRNALLTKYDLVYRFMSTAKNLSVALVLRQMRVADKVHWPSYLVLLVMAYFRDDQESLLKVLSVCT